jgi:transcriptional repressor NrdR
VKCPFCSHLESKVTDSRLSAVGDVTRRRRECEKCARRFTTYERVEEVLPLVVKKDGRREMFDRVKLLGGLRRACDKREIGIARLEQIVDAVERDLIDSSEKEVRAQVIGENVMNHLRTLDDIAYVRFASVYRSFRDIEEFRAELEKIAQDRAPERAPERKTDRTPSSRKPEVASDVAVVADAADTKRRADDGPMTSAVTSLMTDDPPRSRPTPAGNGAKDQPQ